MKSWKLQLKGVPCFIIGYGPSLLDQPVGSLGEYFTIGINRSFRKLDTTILIWQDIELWITERKLLSKLKAIKYARNVADPEKIAYHFKLVPGAYRLPADPSVLYGRGSTGPLAYQLAFSLGCDPIIFLGYDCAYKDGLTDFWGKNRFHKPHTLRNCSRGLQWLKTMNDKHVKGTIINCSDNEALGPKISLFDAIKQVKGKYAGTGREYFSNRLFGITCSESDDKPNKK